MLEFFIMEEILDLCLIFLLSFKIFIMLRVFISLCYTLGSKENQNFRDSTEIFPGLKAK